MAGISYQGDAPVPGMYVLDDGGNLRFYFSEATLVTALQNGYGRSAAHIYRTRPASLRFFDATGITDLSVYIDMAIPTVTTADRKRFAARVLEYRTALQSQIAHRPPKIPAPNPFDE